MIVLYNGCAQQIHLRCHQKHIWLSRLSSFFLPTTAISGKHYISYFSIFHTELAFWQRGSETSGRKGLSSLSGREGSTSLDSHSDAEGLISAFRFDFWQWRSEFTLRQKRIRVRLRAESSEVSFLQKRYEFAFFQRGPEFTFWQRGSEFAFTSRETGLWIFMLSKDSVLHLGVRMYCRCKLLRVMDGSLVERPLNTGADAHSLLTVFDHDP